MKSFPIRVKFARRFPDPVLKHCERHIFMCAVEDLPSDLPTDPNPRAQRIDRGIWKDIRAHLLNEAGSPNTFHLKNKGITLLAGEVDRADDDNYVLKLNDRDGILDGAHTYKLIIDARTELKDRNDANAEEPIQQFVKLEVLTGIEDRALVTEIAGGLNTAIQVQEMSLRNLEGRFNWIKDELKHEPYADKIVFKENEGRPSDDDVRDILVLLDLFNVFEFPNTGSEHPYRAYTSKSEVLESYVKNQQQYENLRPILKDILKLRDIVGREAPDLYNEAGRLAKKQGTGAGAKAGRLTFVEAKQRGMYDFPFTGQQSNRRLTNAALLPMLAAFRWMVEVDSKTGKARWRGGFENVKGVWARTAAELMKRTQQTNLSVGRKANAIGRNPQHWAQLYDFLARAEMQASQGRS